MDETSERVHKLESEVTNLRISNASLSMAVEHLAVAVKSLTATVEVLRDTLNQGRGAIWLAVLGGGGICAMALTLARKLLP